MTENVVTLSGDVAPNEVDSEIVDRLEGLLAKARAGEIRAIAFVGMRQPDIRVWWYKAHPPFGNALLGAICRLEYDLAEELNRS